MGQIVLPTDEPSLVRLLLERNLELRAVALHRDRSQSQIGAVNRLPPTMVKLTPVGEMAETAAGTMQAGVTVEQSFLPMGVVADKKEAARASYDAESAVFRARQIKIVRLFRERLFQRNLSIDVQQIIDQQLELLNQLHAVVDARVANGSALRGNLLEIEMQQSSLRQMHDQWKAKGQEVESQIKYQLSLGQDYALPVEMHPHEWHLTDVVIQQMAVELHPQIQEAQARIRAAEAMSQAEGAAGRPSFSFGVNYTWIDDDGLSPVANGDDQWAVSLGLRIPLDRSTELARQISANELIEQKRWQLKDVEQFIGQDLRITLNNMRSAQKQWLISSDELVIKAKERFQLSKAGYESGKSSYVELMEAWKQYLQQGIQERKLYAAYQQQQCRMIAAFGLIYPRYMSGATDE